MRDRLRRRLVVGLWSLSLALAWAPAFGQAEPGTEAWAEQAVQEIAGARQRLSALDPEQAEQAAFNEMRQVASRRAGEAESCIEATTADLEAVSQRVQTLGEPAEGEAAEVVATRRDLQEEKTALESRQTSCRLVLVRAQELAGAVQQKAQAVMAARLLARGPHLWAVLREAAADPMEWLRQARSGLRQETGVAQLDLNDGIALGAVLAVGLMVGLLGARWLRPARGPWVADFVGGGAVALRAATANWLPVLLPLLGASLYLGMAVAPFSLVALACYGLTAWSLLVVLTNTLLHPPAPARLILNVPEAMATSLGRRIKTLLTLSLIGFLLFVALPREHPGAPHLLVTRAVYAGVLAVNLAWIIALAGHLIRGKRGAALRLAALLLVVAAALAEWSGYRNLAQYLLLGLLGSFLAVSAGSALSHFCGDLFDGLDEGRLAWQSELRRRLGLRSGQRIPGSAWLRALAMVAVWGGSIYLLLVSWGLSQEGSSVILGWFTDGFTIGKVRIVPSQIVAALVMFALLSTVVRWLRQQVVPAWLQRTSLDHGAREAVTTISGYVGVAVAILVALSMAGIDFASLAIVAGALSVGIGFGLQNIVNNFVSGLILLFERPIRKGDWIVVGNTEGYVNRISIRSTKLETFDRSEVIIPNSELATTQVTNWQLRDTWGRVILPVPVAYGSDTEKVRDTLMGVGQAHPSTMQGVPGVPDPVVLFLGYADSALKFELRLFIPQIDMRLQVISDLYFAIDREFRAAGIHVPFPQRDVHLHGGTPTAPTRSPPAPESHAPPAGRPHQGDGAAGLEE